MKSQILTFTILFISIISFAQVSIPDANFEQALINANIDTDGTLNGTISTADAQAKTGLLYLKDKNISDLTGIEAFVNITSLNIQGNNVTTLNMGTNTSILDIQTKNNNISTLDISGCPNLTNAQFSNNALQTVDFSNNLAITEVNIKGNPLNSIDVSMLTNLTRFVIKNNTGTLTELDVSQNTNLVDFDANNSGLLYINVKNGNNTNFTVFNVLTNSLNCIMVDDTAWSTANWTNIDAGISFKEECYVAIPDTNFETKLIALGLDSDNTINQRIKIDDAEAVTGTLNVRFSTINDLTGIEGFTNISTLLCDYNNLTALNMGNNTTITELRASENSITSLDITGCLNLLKLYAYNNNLSTLDLFQNTILTYLAISNNNFNTINITNNTLLETISFHENSFNSLDLSQNLQLKYINFYENTGTLTDLDLSLHTQLVSLKAWNSNLTGVNVKNGNNTNITTFDITDNNLLCVIVDAPSYSTANWTNIDAGTFFSLDCSIAIPDANFEAKLIALGIDSDGTINQKMEIGDALAVTDTLDIPNANILDLTGIEHFTNMTHLLANGNNLTTINLDSNTNLITVSLFNNSLDSLDVTLLTNITELNVSQNNLITLDVSNNTQLETLNISDNNLDAINVNALASLKHFYCNNNTGNLRELYLNQNWVLETIEARNSNLSWLNTKNGAYWAINTFDVTQNNLTCILVDDVSYSNSNWTNIDAGTGFSTDCTVSIPDTNFEATLIALGIDTDNTINQKITILDAENTTGILNVSNSSIANLAGIQAFTNITELQANNNTLTSIDLGANNTIVKVVCSDNPLTNLDVTDCPTLTHITADNTDLASVNLTNNPSLLAFACIDCELITLDVSQNTQLANLFIGSNKLNSLDLSNNTLLAKVFINNNMGGLTHFDLQSNINLTHLGCDNANLISLNVKNGNNTNVGAFFATGNNFTCVVVDDATYSTNNWTNIDAQVYFDESCVVNIPDNVFEQKLINLGIDTDGTINQTISINDAHQVTNTLPLNTTRNTPKINNLSGIEHFINLKGLNISNNNISSIDVSNLTNLEFLETNNNPIDTIDLSNNLLLKKFININGSLDSIILPASAAMTYLDVRGCNLKHIDISNQTALTLLSVEYCSLGNLDISNNPLLQKLYVNRNNLKTLNLSIHTNLKELNLEYNQLTSLDVSNNPLLTYLNLRGNNLTSIDVTNNIALQSFYVNKCQLTTINVNNLTNLTTFHCHENQLTALDVSNNTALKILNCTDNQLTHLDISNDTLLEELYCSNNSLDSIITTTNPQLEYLHCSNNQLTALNFQNNPKLLELECDRNQLTILDCSNTRLATLICYDNQLTYIDLKGTILSTKYQDDDDDYYVALHSFELNATNNPNLKCIIIDKVILPNHASMANHKERTHKDLFDLPAQVTTDSTVITVPNISFERWLSTGYHVETDDMISRSNGFIYKGSAEALTGTMTLSASFGTIDDLKGIEAFTNITKLNAAGFNLTTVDMGNNPTIQSIKVSSNDLVSIDVSQCSNLNHLQVEHNELPSIDVSNNLNLSTFSIFDNPNLKALDLSNNGSLTKLWARDSDSLQVIKMANGNNANVTYFGATNSPNLVCIEVDDENAAYLSGWSKDAATIFANDCDAHLPAKLQAKLFLSGAYDTNTGLMNDDLRTNNLIPTIEPYSAMAFTFVLNAGGTTIANDVLQVTGDDAIVDWILVELRDKNDSSVVIETHPALLQKDGDVVDVDGISPIEFTSLGDEYFIAFYHRNHLALLSQNAITLGFDAVLVDFTTTPSLVKGGTAAFFDLSNGIYGCISGDYNGDGQVQNADISTLRPFIGTSGYSNGDLDMNGQIQNSDIQSFLIPMLGKGKQF